MTKTSKRLRAVVAVPLADDLRELMLHLEPRLDVVHERSLLPPARGPADWSGDPSFVRSAKEQKDFEAMIDSAEALFGIPDARPAALARTVSANPDLQWVMTMAAGGGSEVRAAQLDSSALERIIFTTSAGVHGGMLAEFALFGVLSGIKDLRRLQTNQSARKWTSRWEMGQLSAMTVLVVGLGGIGMECVRAFSSMGARVLGTNLSGRAVDGVERVVPLDELPQIVGTVDAIVMTVPGTPKTRYLIGDSLLANVKPGTVVVNVGRGTAIDERALLTALDDGRVSFAALDVFEVEPLPTSSPLWSHPRVLVSPHTAALSSAEAERIVRRFAENATRLLDDRPMRAVVNTVEFY